MAGAASPSAAAVPPTSATTRCLLTVGEPMPIVNALGRLKALRAEAIDPKIAEHRGRLVKTTGDGLLVEFASVVDALRCAGEIQAALAARNGEAPAERRIEFRIGI